MSYSKAYLQGFYKKADDAGLNPEELLKAAKDNNWLSSIVSSYKSMDPELRRAILGGLITGAGTYALSDGSTSQRLGKGLLGGVIGGAGIYGLDRTGLTNKGINLLHSGLDFLRPPRG